MYDTLLDRLCNISPALSSWLRPFGKGIFGLRNTLHHLPMDFSCHGIRKWTEDDDQCQEIPKEGA
jgi:hypothetical protein